MKATTAAKTMLRPVLDSFETIRDQIAAPMGTEALSELFGVKKGLSKIPKEMATEELQRARQKQRLDEMDEKDEKASQESANQIFAAIKNEYTTYQQNTNKEQQQLKEEFVELQSEVVKLAKVAGVDTKAHVETAPKKIGILDIKKLTKIVKFLRVKAEESKSAKELVAQRSNAKRTTGMLAWVSGKQMKVHEQGTLQLQG